MFQLENLISQTYVIEDEYKSLTFAYKQLQNSIEQIVEFLPNPLWVLEENSSIFLQNSKAKELFGLLEKLNLQESDYEVNYKNSFFLIKIEKYKNKTAILATDVTEHKRKERLITMGQMATHLSHEIRNPTASISLLSSSLAKRVSDKEKPIVFEIQKSVFRIERIIKATLMYSKGILIKKSGISLIEIQKEVENSINYYSFSKEVEFIFNLPDIEINVDMEMIVILFSNFIFNAIDAIESDENQSGKIEINYLNNNKYHIFKILDTGLEFENKESLFEAFKSTKEKGNGLGLVLSKQIAELHNGYIEVIDEKLKGFSIFIEI